MCVCFWDPCALKIFVERYFWELNILFGSLVELHAWLHSYLCFFLFEKLFLSNLDNFLTPPRHLAIYQALKLFLITISTPSRQLSGSIKKTLVSSIASRQLVDRSSFFNRVWWILPWHLSIAAFVDVFLLDTYLDRCLDTSRHLYLLRFTEPLYIGYVWSGFHFSRSLSRQTCLFTS